MSKHRTSGKLIFEYEDESGLSPLNTPGIFHIKLEFWYYPPEPMVRYYSDGSGYPGCPEEIDYEVESIIFENKIVTMNLGDWLITLDSKIREYIKSYVEEINDYSA